MIVIILLISSVILNIALCVILYQKERQIIFVNKIRVGYEKRCNSFRIRYSILIKMENQENIIRNVKSLDQDIYIYGRGIIGKKLFTILEGGKNNKILGFLEGKELEGDNAIRERIDKKAVIIVTPVFDYDNIVKLLTDYVNKSNIISIDEIL